MKYKSQISILLVIALIMGCMGWAPATAQQVQEENVAPSVAETSQKESLTEDSKILDYVDSEQFLQSDHIARLPQEETLDSYVFLNRDGSKSIYYMGHPVKYVDENGSIREKDTTLVRGNGGYSMRDNDVALHIPDAAATGITMSHNKRTVKLIPQGGGGSALQQDNSIAYVNYFGKGTILRYTPMLSGMKEDIILAQYTGQNSFTFLLETNGLNLYEDQGQYYLAENHNAEAVFYLGQIEVYDAIGRPDLGTMTVETVVPGQRYRLTVSADEDFLTDPKTVYPVTIDPTLTVRDTEEVRGTLEDTPVYSYYPNGIFGNYVFNPMGFVSDHGIGKTAVRLTSLLTDTNYSQLTADQLNSVTFYIKGSGGYYQNVSIHALTENSTWTEMTLTWNTLGAYTETAYATKNMGGSAWNAFNITNLAKDWKNGIQNPQCGFVMVSDSTTSNVSFFSGEYGTIDYRPYVVVNYTNVITLDQTSATLYKGDTLTLSATTIPAGQAVTWLSSDSAVASVSDTGVVTALTTGNTTITATLEDGTTAQCEVEVIDKTITFRYDNINVYMGIPKAIPIEIVPEDEPVLWTSLNPSIATVANGVVTGISIGHATIRAELNNGASAECIVKVSSRTISLDYASKELYVGDTFTLKATVIPPEQGYIWESDNEDVATVANGVVTGKGAGQTTIRAVIDEEIFAECTVNVLSKSITLNYTNVYLYKGESFTLRATTVPPDANVVWRSDDENIATVVNGLVTCKNAGQTVIRAIIDETTFATCTVNVSPCTITLNYYTAKIAKGDYTTVVATTVPANQTVSWSSSNEAVATVSSSGVVRGLSAGDATITATLPDGTSKSCTVKVRYVGTLNYSSKNLIDGDDFTLTLSTEDPIDVVWQSSDTSIATVSADGQVFGVNLGVVQITASSPDLMEPVSCLVTVHLAERLYWIQNRFNWLQLTSLRISIFNNTAVIQEEDISFMSELDYLTQLWRITYVGGEYYTIRPAFKLSLGLSVDAYHDVRLVDIGIEEREAVIPANALWKITPYGNGYRLECKEYPGFYLMPYAGSSEARRKIICEDDGTSPACIWGFSAKSIVPHAIAYSKTTGKTCEDPEVNVERYGDLCFADVCEDIVFSIASNTGFYQDLSWSTDTPDLIRVDENGNLHGVGYGTANIIVTPDVSGSAKSSSYEVYVTKFKLTGYELPYQPELWADPDVIRLNCFSYAMNSQWHPILGTLERLHPGFECGKSLEQSMVVKKENGEPNYNIVDMLIEDSICYASTYPDYPVFYFMPKDDVEEIPEGAYLIALCISSEMFKKTYHFYRQNPDGTWSHKNDSTPVSNVDGADNIIYDPETACHNYGATDAHPDRVGLNYHIFLGFFYVIPFNSLV